MKAAIERGVVGVQEVPALYTIALVSGVLAAVLDACRGDACSRVASSRSRHDDPRMTGSWRLDSRLGNGIGLPERRMGRVGLL